MTTSSNVPDSSRGASLKSTDADGADGLRRLAGNVSWTTLDQGTRVLVSFLVSVQVINYLGPANFGLYAYVLSVVGIVAPLAAFGQEQVLVRELVRRPGERAQLLGTSFAIRAVGGVVAYVVVVAIVAMSGDAEAVPLTFIVGLTLLMQPVDTIATYLRSIQRARGIAFSRLSGLAVGACGTVVLLLRNGTIVGFTWMRVIDVTVATLALVVVYRVTRERWRDWRVTRRDLRTLMRDGFPLFITSASIMVYMRIDQVMLVRMSSLEEIGNYAVAVRLAEVINFVPVALVAYLYPTLIRDRETGSEAFRARVLWLFRLMTIFGYAIALLMTVGASFGFDVLFGQRFAAAVPMFIVLSWSSVFVCLGVVKSTVVSVEGHFWSIAITSICGVVVNVGLNLCLIPVYGGLGAAIATLVAQWFVAHPACLLFRSQHWLFALQTRAMVTPSFRWPRS